ncbi:MAG: SDR family oxidoreductase [Proteobacteria bacterium]|nr:SDR family oxidoreductase [Pseudomonadota bacterium]
MTDRRKAIVTGAASGIGAATLLELARAGYDVAGLDLNRAGVDEVARRAAHHGARSRGFTVDVTDEAALVAAFGAACDWLGGLDALATSAGVADTTPFMDVTVQRFRDVYAVNVIGTFVCLREAALHMKPGGRICTVASVAGLRGGGLSGTAAYAASKGAVLALTKNAARALAERGISVNTVAPGATLTPMIEQAWKNEAHRRRVEGMAVQNRTAAPEEIAKSIAFLLSPDASIVTGATLVADGGLVMY